ncbi:unnamed protein product, partial [Staurois parvus]
DFAFPGGKLLVNKTVLLPVSSYAEHSHAKQCACSEAQTQHHVKQHTDNSLIATHVNPLLPSAISTVSVLFISTDHCTGVTEDVSDTTSVPPSVTMPAAVP